jgi:hypothetical protein
MVMNYGWKMMWKQAGRRYFKALLQHLPERTAKNKWINWRLITDRISHNTHSLKKMK